MKKSILLIAAVLLTISAFAFAQWNKAHLDEKKQIGHHKSTSATASLPFYIPQPTKLYYNIGSRFMPIKKSKIHQATTVRDFFTDYDQTHMVSVQHTNLILIKDDKHTRTQFKGNGAALTKEQSDYLRSCTYSTNLKLSISGTAMDQYNEQEEAVVYTPHFSIVPEQEARYDQGKQAFINYLIKNNKVNAYGLDNDKLGFAKLTFTINKDGSISKTTLDRSCGYKKIDQTMFQLLKNAPGKWIPAVNAEGENVAQELVISFGKDGC